MSLARLMGKAAKGAAPVAEEAYRASIDEAKINDQQSKDIALEIARESILKGREERLRGYEDRKLNEQRQHASDQLEESRNYEQSLVNQENSREDARNVVDDERANRELELLESKANGREAAFSSIDGQLFENAETIALNSPPITTAPGIGDIPSGAVDLLQSINNEQVRKIFDNKYGAGASERILRNQ